jgi:DNA-binding transcriptional MocR family regulator
VGTSGFSAVLGAWAFCKRFGRALREGIGIAPGRIFTLGDRYGNCFRLNAAFWSERCEQAVETLGGIAEGMG